MLILAGEAVFILPFVLTRVFRPTILEVFKLSNLELGAAQSMYGIVAVFAYLVGGPLAASISAQKTDCYSIMDHCPWRCCVWHLPLLTRIKNTLRLLGIYEHFSTVGSHD